MPSERCAFVGIKPARAEELMTATVTRSVRSGFTPASAHRAATDTWANPGLASCPGRRASSARGWSGVFCVRPPTTYRELSGFV
jgi:hypothetical protein